MGKQNHTPGRRSLHESFPAQLQHLLEMQEKLLVLSHVLGSGAIACDRIWPTVREATTRNMTSSYQSSFTEKYKGLVGKKSCFAQSDRLTQWQSMTHENTF